MPHRALSPVLGPATWWHAQARIRSNQVAPLTDALIASGFTGFSTTCGDDGRAELELWHDAARLPAPVLRALKAADVPAPKLRARSEASVMADLLPSGRTRVASGLWLDHVGDLRATPRRRVVRIPPSHAWGDGRHPTTRMLAQRLLDVPPQAGAAVLDLGCGTLILGLTALELGAGSVTGTDIDPNAIAAARAALRANGRRGQVRKADLLRGVRGSFHVVIANLYVDLLLRLGSDARLRALLATDAARLLISGVSRGRLAEVDAHFVAHGWMQVWRSARGFWAAAEYRPANGIQPEKRSPINAVE